MATLTTPRLGIPYPDGNERVQDGDNAMGAIASTLDDLTKTGVPYRIAAGTVSVTVTSAVSGSSTITFPAGRFTQNPVCTAVIASSTQSWFVTISGPTTTSTTATVINRDGTTGTATVNVAWMAVQMTSSSGAG